jgi:hypothetical protein
MYQEATGNDAPSGGLLIDSPSDLSNRIEAENKERGYDKLENPLP